MNRSDVKKAMKMRRSVGLLSLVVVALVIDRQQVTGHGSHQHMRNHQHYLPKVDSRAGKVNSVLEEKKMIQDRE